VKTAVDTAYRWSVASRFVAAGVGGYAVVTLLQLAMNAVFGAEGYKALLLTSQTGYLCYTGIIIWCFATRTATRAWTGLGLVCIPLLLRVRHRHARLRRQGDRLLDDA
jgi:uncharacterized protein DUF3649